MRRWQHSNTTSGDHHAPRTVMPPNACIEETFANDVVDLVLAEGKNLEDKLRALRLASWDEDPAKCYVDLAVVQKYLTDHCVVMTGGLVNTYWPLYRSKSKERKEHYIRTCLCYVQHAECEHQYFTMAVEPGDGPNLRDAPDVSRRGRKRKQGDR